MPIHPLQTTRDLRNSYERYLKTIYPFQDPTLRERFWERLVEPDRLVKGPILEASPPYEIGQTVGELVTDGTLARAFMDLCATTAALPSDRPLYLHQEKAIRNVVGNGRNLIVATGTGSGKTESFLIPIIDHLLREQEANTLSQPGVRALLLYPMNALANDQLGRLRALLEHFPTITYGRYTGETLESQTQALDAFREREGTEPPPNELLSRELMRQGPPHILLTNYAMLEYLLLRPQDTELFDGSSGSHWRFIVVDEAHVYDGAAGIEVGMLLRRLKDRIGANRKQLTCIATSATLGRGEQDFPKTARFGQELFGEPFTAEDVFSAERRPASALGDTWGEGAPSMYAELRVHLAEATNDDDRSKLAATIAAIAVGHGVPESVAAEIVDQSSASAALYALLRGDSRVQRLQEVLVEPRALESVATNIFDMPEVESQAAIVDLVDLAVQARPDDDTLPLLPARYHVFARALEGAFACLNKSAIEHSRPGPQLFLHRHETCPECRSAVFELATCSRCGASYVVGEMETVDLQGERADRLRLAQGAFASEAKDHAFFILEEELPDVNEDELEEEDEAAEEWTVWSLCLRCGVIVADRREPPCNCHTWRTVRRHETKGRDPSRMTCGKCQTRSQSVVYRLLTGQDAPVSVLATQVYSQLSPSTNLEIAQLQGQGRKMLIFADSRQDAAFLAPYLERTGRNVLYRRLILQMLLEDPDVATGELKLDSLANILQRRVQSLGVLDPEGDPYSWRTETQKWLIRELTSPGHRQGLEELGLLRLELSRPPQWTPPLPLLEAPWNMTPDEVWDLECVLLDTVRQQGGVRFPDGVDPQDVFFAPRNRPYYLVRLLPEDRGARKRHTLKGWSPRSNSNTRANILEKLLLRTAPTLDEAERRTAARTALDKLWDHLHSGVWEAAWQTVSLPKAGVAFQLNYNRWTWAATDNETPLWRCDHCRRMSQRSLRGMCPVYGCDGDLSPVSLDDLQGENQHYRYLYRQLPPAYLTVEEHTAQWNAEEAARIQKEFIDGKVNILSCSTTFELGVDVGSLNVVLMRNVPPTTANYIQRAGRAGRRQDTAAFVLTFAQRRSHDLAYYQRPERMVAGQVQPPNVTILNPLIVRRHMASVLIAGFLRWCVDEHFRFATRQEMRVGEFFVPEKEGKLSGPELLARYLNPPPQEIGQALRRIVPEALHNELQLEDWGWLDGLVNEEKTGVFDLATAQIEEDITLFHNLGVEASADHSQRGAVRAGYFFGVEATIRRRDLINEFGRQGVLPKYGFPVDVVPMHTEHINLPAANRIELQRDLRIGLSEFAPGSQIVAAKTIWTGGGLYKMPQREWESINFAICKKCGRFNGTKGEDKPGVCQGCGQQPLESSSGKQGKFVCPEFGFVAAPTDGSSVPGDARPPRSYTSRVYFNERTVPAHVAPDAESHWPEYEAVRILNGPSVQFANRYSHYGELVVINHGPTGGGFEICHRCGFGQPAPAKRARTGKSTRKPNHVNPRTGWPCDGYLTPSHLGHTFITDVLELKTSGFLARVEVGQEERLWWSVLYALLEGASEALQIKRSDLNGTRYFTRDADAPVLVFYDDVPGGAGHVRRVAEAWSRVFEHALARVEACSCGPETACHECLWNYYNQPFHGVLSRGTAADFLRGVLANSEI